MEFELLETERLILKKLTPEVLAYILTHYTKSDSMKLLGLSTEAELVKEKEKSGGGYTTYDRTIVAFLLVSKESGVTLGRCGYHNWYKDHKKAEIGYALQKEEYKQQGYMTEAIKAIIAYGFHTMGLNRIEACIGPANIASQKLVLNNGFTQEGYLRQHYIRDNEIQDSLIFSLLREEYRS